MKAFFLSRAWREKVLLTGFVLLMLLSWAGALAGRAQAAWTELRSTRAEQAAQQVWLENAAVIEARAAGATRHLDPAKVINATGLVGELSAMAARAGLGAEIGSQHTLRTDRLAFHTLQVNARRVDLGTLLRFYAELSARAPYIGLEQVTIVADRNNPGQLSASLRVGSVELAP